MTTTADKYQIRRDIAKHGAAAKNILDNAVTSLAFYISAKDEAEDRTQWYWGRFQAYHDALSWILGYQDENSWDTMHDALRDYIEDEAIALNSRNAEIWAAV